MKHFLQDLKNRQLVWQAGKPQTQSTPRVSSGYSQLDEYLEGGWPCHGVIQLQTEQSGIGELRLLLPALQELASQDKWQAWVQPPARLCPHSFEPDTLSRTLVVTPSNPKQSLWVSEQILTSGCFSAMVLWSKTLSPSQAKRLQLAARDSQTLAFVISPLPAQDTSLALSMRMRVGYWERGLTLHIFKRQHAWPLPAFNLDMSTRWPRLFSTVDATSVKTSPPADTGNILNFPPLSRN